MLDQYHQLQHQTPDTNIEWPIYKCPRDFRVSPPYNPSPGTSRTPEPGSKISLSVSFSASWLDFFAFRNALQKRLRKNIEKIAKIMDFGFPKLSQNPSKMPPKSMFQKTCDFSLIFADFWLLVARPEPQISCAHAMFC